MRPDGSLPVKRAVARRLTDLSALHAAPPEPASGFKLRERAPAPSSPTLLQEAIQILRRHLLRSTGTSTAFSLCTKRCLCTAGTFSTVSCADLPEERTVVLEGKVRTRTRALAVHLRAPASYLLQPLGPAADLLCLKLRTCSAAHQLVKHQSSACSSKLSYYSCTCPVLSGVQMQGLLSDQAERPSRAPRCMQASVLRIQYAVWTQPGMEPGGFEKDNQASPQCTCLNPCRLVPAAAASNSDRFLPEDHSKQCCLRDV